MDDNETDPYLQHIIQKYLFQIDPILEKLACLDLDASMRVLQIQQYV